MTLSSWFDKGRPAIFEALATICDQIDEDVKKELEEKGRYAVSREELAKLKSVAAKAERLEKENKQLRETVHSLREKQSNKDTHTYRAIPKTNLPQDLDETVLAPPPPSTNPGELVAPPFVPFSSTPSSKALLEDGSTDWQTEVVKLDAKYRALNQAFETAKTALIKRKEERDKWIHYANHLEKKLRTHQQQQQQQQQELEKKQEKQERGHDPGATFPTSASNSSNTPASRSNLRMSVSKSFPAADAPTLSDTESIPMPLAISALNNGSSYPLQQQQKPTTPTIPPKHQADLDLDLSSSPPTARKAMDRVLPTTEPIDTDITPTKPVLKSRHGPPRHQGKGSKNPSFFEKETMSDHMFPSSDANPSATDDASSDSGAGHHMVQKEANVENQLPKLPKDGETERELVVSVNEEPSSDAPVIVSERLIRKRKDNDSDINPNPPRKIKAEESSLPPTTDVAPFSPHLSLDLDPSDVEATPRGKTSQDHDSHQIDSMPSSNLSSELDMHPSSDVVDPEGDRPPLQPIADNHQSQSQPPLQSCPGNDDVLGREYEKYVNRAVERVAESGEYVTNNKPSRSTKPVKNSSSTSGRLASLLDKDTTEFDGGFAPPERRELPFDNKYSRMVSKSFGPTTSSTSLSSSLATTSRQAPRDTSFAFQKPPALAVSGKLRSKPIGELRITDFKVNPRYNEGRDYAFSDVVRSREERSGLSGCTDPNCCGQDFRALARAERGTMPRTPQQRFEDRKLLERFLGDAAHRLAHMTKPEMEELWVEARAKELADKVGRHRHRFFRMQTPPGFWNPDFPTSQEMEEERREAQKREEHAVQERYREAMRTNGRWTFRDE